MAPHPMYNYEMNKYPRRGLAIIIANFLETDFPDNRKLVDAYEKMYRNMGFDQEDIIKSTDLKVSSDGKVYILGKVGFASGMAISNNC